MMLSGLLKSDIAVKVNIQIIDAFVKMRRYFANSISNVEPLKNNPDHRPFAPKIDGCKEKLLNLKNEMINEHREGRKVKCLTRN